MNKDESSVTEKMPSVAPIPEVIEYYYDSQLRDYYRYMEDLNDCNVQAWIREQPNHTKATLASLPGRNALLRRIQELEDAVVARVSNVQRSPAGLYFYLKRLSAENCFKLYVRVRINERETLLVDPEAFQQSSRLPHFIDYFSASPDGRHVVYGISAMGSEDSSLNVVDGASGKQIGQPIDRTRFARPSWLPDGSGFFYNRLPITGTGAPATERLQKSAVYFHKLGTDPEGDHLVFGNGIADVQIQPTDIPYVYIDSRQVCHWMYFGQREPDFTWS